MTLIVRMPDLKLSFWLISINTVSYMQEYFSDETVKEGISTSGWFQEDTIQHVNDCFSVTVEENDLDKFFEASTIEEQRICFQKISSGLEETIL